MDYPSEDFSEFSETYKRVIIHKSEDFLSLDFQYAEDEDSICRNTHIDFVGNKLLYSGDYGTFVFGKNIQDVRTFFNTRYPNYQYWREKLEAYSENPDVEEYDYMEDIIEKVTEYFKNYNNLYYNDKVDYSQFGWDNERIQNLKEKSRELESCLQNDLFFESDYSINNVYKIVSDTLKEFNLEYCDKDEYESDYELDDETLWSILQINDYSDRYKRLCRFCCWVENNLDEWLKITGDNGTIFLQNLK